MNEENHIARLLRCVEEKAGRAIDSPTMFNWLSVSISKTTGESVSISTLKRIWGYVSYASQPSISVLSILSRYVGFSGWTSFVEGEPKAVDSDFLSDKIITASTLKPGERIELCWQPDRRVVLECLGNNRFRVVESHNSKIFQGNTFKADIFAEGMPFYVTDLRQNFDEGKIYVAGERHGLTSVKKL